VLKPSSMRWPRKPTARTHLSRPAPDPFRHRPGPAGGHIRVTNDQIAADNSGHHRFGILPGHRVASARYRRSPRPARAPSHEGSQGYRRSSVPRKTSWAAGRRMARTGFPPTPGSRRRGSVDARPRYGGRAACPPGPSDSPSLETHGGARRPALSGGTSARLAAAPCTPFLRLPPRWGTTLRPTETNTIQRSTQ
jgi:hypothetical protein